MVACLLVFFALANLTLSFMIARFEVIFAEMLGDLPLPTITQFTIYYGRSGLAQLIPILLPLAAFVLLLLKRERGISWSIALCVIFFLTIAAILVTYALFLPMVTIITEMNAI